jgi:hypothetical protein
MNNEVWAQIRVQKSILEASIYVAPLLGSTIDRVIQEKEIVGMNPAQT